MPACRLKSFLLLCLLFLFSSCMFCQGIDSLLTRYNGRLTQQKLYIHFDNSTYVAGQTVFFKAYARSGTELSDLDKNLYIDWIDEAGNIVDRTVSPMRGYTWWGSYTIPVSFRDKRLHVMAYTKWMMNFDSAFLFHHSLEIMGNRNNIPITKETATFATIDFFPEGGDLVENLASTIAFKASNSNGYPIAVKGTIMNSSGQKITQFQSQHNGMGKFVFTSAPGEVYTAEWMDEQGFMHTTKLPAAKTSGLVLSLDAEVKPIKLTVERTGNADASLKQLELVATINQQAVLLAKIDLGKQTRVSSTIPLTHSPSGVVQITLLDANRRPVAERIIFVNNKEYGFRVELAADTIDFGKKKKNVVSIRSTDSMQTALSLSITDGNPLFASSTNIVSQLLLSGELRGNVYQPQYYFSEADSASAYLDLVMLTHGWRRFRWEDVFSGKTPVLSYPADTAYISVSGRLNNPNRSRIKPESFVGLRFESKDSSRQVIFATLKKDGSFGADHIIVYDSNRVTYQVDPSIANSNDPIQFPTNLLLLRPNNRISLQRNYLTANSNKGFVASAAAEQMIITPSAGNMTLQEVTVSAKTKTRIQELDERYTSGLFRDNGFQLNVVDDVVGGAFSTVLGYLQNRAAIPGLVFDLANKEAPVTWRGGGRKNDGITAFFIDEMALRPEDLGIVSMSDVAYIKIFRPPFAMAKLNGPGGAIAIYTKKGGDNKFINLGTIYSWLAGYSSYKEFYHPVYSEQTGDTNLADTRSTLFWKPDILLDGHNREMKMVFYNNDLSSSFRIVLEGVAADGRIIYETKFIGKSK